MSEETKTKQSFSRVRRWVLGFNSVLAILALLALLAMVNYLAGGYYKRFQLDSQSGVRLQPQTLRILNSLTEDVSVTIFFDPHDEDGYEKEIYTLTTSLLREYHNASKHISVTNLNYVEFPNQAKELLMSHHLASLENKDFILFECHGHPKIIDAKSLSDYDLASVISGGSKELRRTTFRGELLFTSAIFAVAHPQPLKACFLQGHGECKPDGASSEDSYAKLANILKEETVTDWQSLSLLGTNTVPADCQLLIIAGPRLTHFQPSEIEKIDTYLKQGNRLLLLLDNQFNSGIEALLSKYGVGVSTNGVREQNPKYMDPKEGRLFYGAQLGAHPTLNPISIEKVTSLVFFSPRSFDLKGSSQTPGSPVVSELVRTSDQATDGHEQRAFTIAIALEQGAIKGVNAPRGGTRIIALGDSSMFSDPLIDSGANHVFAGLALNWLMDRPEILLNGITVQPIKEFKLMMTQSQMRSVQLLFLGGMPGAVLFIGWLVWLRRRR